MILLFRSFWKTFIKNSLQVLGFLIMLIASITILCGMALSHDLTQSQYNILSQNIIPTNSSYTITGKNLSNSNPFSLTLNKKIKIIPFINYENSDTYSNFNHTFFEISSNVDDHSLTLTLDDDNSFPLNQSGNGWIAENSGNLIFNRIKTINNGRLSFKYNAKTHLIQNSPYNKYIFNDIDFSNFKTLLVPNSIKTKNANVETIVLPFVNSPILQDEAKLYFSDGKYYKDFAKNNTAIYNYETKLLASALYLYEAKNQNQIYDITTVYDIFNSHYFYIQNVLPENGVDQLVTRPYMYKGSFQTFLNDKSPGIIINRAFASNNGIKIGQKLNIYGNQYTVDGFATNFYVNTYDIGNISYNCFAWLLPNDFSALIKSLNSSTYLYNESIYFYAPGYVKNLQALELNNKDFTNSWKEIAKIFHNVAINKTINNSKIRVDAMKTFISVKETSINLLISAISLLLIISALVMITMITSKLLILNKKIIGNLKAQGYRLISIYLSLAACFFILVLFACLITIGTSFLLSYVINLTYNSFLEFTTYTPSLTGMFFVYDLVIPLVIIIGYVSIFLLKDISKKPLVLLNPKEKRGILGLSVVARYFQKINFLNINFKYKISLKFAYDAKWKLLLTIIVTSLTAAILFSGFSTLGNFFQVSYNLTHNVGWSYSYNFNDNYKKVNDDNKEEAPYNFVFFNNQSDLNYQTSGQMLSFVNNKHSIKAQKTEWLNLDNYCSAMPTSINQELNLQYKWIDPGQYQKFKNNETCKQSPYYSQIIEVVDGFFNNNSPFKFIFDKLVTNHGKITIGYQPVNSHFILSANNEKDNKQKTENNEIFGELQDKDLSMFKLSQKGINLINYYYSKDSPIRDNTTIWWYVYNNVEKDYINNQMKNIEFYNYQNNNNVFIPSLSSSLNMEDFYKVNSFNNENEGMNLYNFVEKNSIFSKYMKDNMKNLLKIYNEMNLHYNNSDNISKPNIYPLLLNKSFQYYYNLQPGDIFINITDLGNINLYYILDFFTNGSSYLGIQNKYFPLNNNNFIDEIQPTDFNYLFSSNKNNSMYSYIGIYNDEHDYVLKSDSPYIDGNYLPINKGQMSLLSTIQSVKGSQELLLLFYTFILFFSILVCIFQIFIITNVIIKDNLNIINAFRALGYSEFWIFNRSFFVYLPIIIISWLISIPIGFLMVNYIRLQLMSLLKVYVGFSNSPVNFFISIIGLFVLFIIGFFINKVFVKYRYPMLYTINSSTES